MNASNSSLSARKRRSLPALATHSARRAFAILAQRRVRRGSRAQKASPKISAGSPTYRQRLMAVSWIAKRRKTISPPRAFPSLSKPTDWRPAKASSSRKRRGKPRRPSTRAFQAHSARPERKSSSRNSCKAKKRASSRFATASTLCRLRRLKITSASATAIPDRTPAAWAHIRRLRS